MSREIEQNLADYINTELAGLVEVRTGENADTIPESAMITVHLESQTARESLITNLFNNIFKITLQMHYSDKTEAEMDQAGSSVLNSLISHNLSADLGVYHAKLEETKSEVRQGMWVREFTLTTIGVDNAS